MDTDELIYLATPYSKYKDGLNNAFVDTAKITAKLLQSGLRVYSPIVHTHPIAIYGNIDPYDHDVWLPFDRIMMEKADTLYVVLLDGWRESYGVAHEIDVFTEAGKPIWYYDPATGRTSSKP